MSSPAPVRGRGTASNPHNRFAPSQSVAEDDGWYQEVPLTQGTTVTLETAKSIITRATPRRTFHSTGQLTLIGPG
ncbi:hypothetical protein AO386_07760 [Pseudomonas syringae ICMP 11292]|nr:hypothetical protein AO386_07760 [Pseudomonas syringae ICMP 11292]